MIRGLTGFDPLLPLVTGSYRAGQRRTLPGNLRRRLVQRVYSAHWLWPTIVRHDGAEESFMLLH
jgi:hypothetical protein